MWDTLVLAMDTWARDRNGDIIYWNGVPQHRYVNGEEFDLAWVGYVYLGIVALIAFVFLLKAGAAAAAGRRAEALSNLGNVGLTICVGLMLPMIIVFLGGLLGGGNKGNTNA